MSETLTLPPVDHEIASMPRDPFVEEIGDVALEQTTELEAKVAAELHTASILESSGRKLDDQFLRDKFGLNEEQIDAATVNAEAMRDKARVAIRIPRYGFEAMLKDGQYKTVHETHTTKSGSISGTGPASEENSYGYRILRDEAEERQGFAPQDGAPAIVHGYLDNNEGRDADPVLTSEYGDLAITLKPEVMRRSTFTAGDSGRPENIGIFSPNDALIINEANSISRYTNTGRSIPYTEAQIQGGVTLDDVESLSVEMLRGKEQNEHWETPQDIAELLESVQAINPDLPVTVKVPAEQPGSFTLDILELAQQYPNAKFVGTVDLNRTNYAQTPFTQEHRRRKLESVGVDTTNTSFQHETAKVSDSYQVAQQRKEQLEVGIKKMWQEHYLEVPMPTNVSFVVRR